ncbi:MAG TPA: glutamine amidotransferase [Candidatus Saccharimonadia bacterium]|nr:glutamine amidotransferase [Candidatus Saccharimonadia bacterium]
MSTQGRVVIAHLYPREMNIYGDLGNIIALVKRLEWRGYQAEVRPVEVGEPFEWAAVDLVFGGGGQDAGQFLVGADLQSRGAELRQLAADGVPMLTICGTYQLFGRGFTTVDGREIPGIDIFRASTIGGSTRMVGNIIVDSPFGRLVGFENHSGQTLLESGQEPLGRVRRGSGNDPRSRHEGAITGNAIGTYLHGPVLPKNPALTDHLLLTALRRRYGLAELPPLDDALERQAAKAAMARPR